MISIWLVVAAACLATVQAAAPEKRASSYIPNPKYFMESQYGDHYDARFAQKALSKDEVREAIVALMQTYLGTVHDLGIQTWLMHGTLLGWWWGKHVMPWDPDADVQITEADMYFLFAYYNKSKYFYRPDGIPEGRTYLLEINPYFKYRELDDQLNFIDARWIDMSTGLYIDITAARYAVNHPEGEGVLYDKHGHQYRDTYLYPLRKSTFEGMPVMIPYRYADMLRSEYSEKALWTTTFKEHTFDKEAMRWVPVQL